MKATTSCTLDLETSAPVYTAPFEILSFISEIPGDYFMGGASVFRGRVGSSEMFTTSQFETRKLIHFDEPIPLPGSVPLRAFPDYDIESPQYSDYVLEVCADGIYLVASSQKTVRQGARIRFAGAVPLSLDERR
jgi:hypothetical protein